MPPSSDPSVARKIKLLIVEDHAATREALHALLGGAVGEHRLQIWVADSAEAAICLVETEAPDIVIMDISLPGMNGIEATRIIRRLAPATDVVMHSNNDTESYREMSASVGASAFVSKRHTARELVPAILEILKPAA
jgi:DNA-binding NarL/FixJ family response regulator